MDAEQIVLAGHPVGEPRPEDFRIERFTPAEPGPGEALCRTIYLSLDPYMRGRMNGRPGYAEPIAIGEAIVGGTVGEVIRSNAPELKAGDIVLGGGGWRSHWTAPGATLRRLDPQVAPISSALGALGMPGLTAYAGLLELGNPKPSQTVLVSAASGAVGALVGQIAMIKGCRAVGIAGGEAKCRYVTEELGFSACIDHRRTDFQVALSMACADGVDVLFENIGANVFMSGMRLLSLHARIIVCGFVSAYNLAGPPPGPDSLPEVLGHMLVKRASMFGLLVGDHEGVRASFEREMALWMREGRVKTREDIVVGLENAIEAFRGLLQGQNFGKLLVKVSDDPTL